MSELSAQSSQLRLLETENLQLRQTNSLLLSKGELFYWTTHMCSCRFGQSGGGTDSVAEATGGKVNAGYFCEGPTGERKTYGSVLPYEHKHIIKSKKVQARV